MDIAKQNEQNNFEDSNSKECCLCSKSICVYFFISHIKECLESFEKINGPLEQPQSFTPPIASDPISISIPLVVPIIDLQPPKNKTKKQALINFDCLKRQKHKDPIEQEKKIEVNDKKEENNQFVKAKTILPKQYNPICSLPKNLCLDHGKDKNQLITLEFENDQLYRLCMRSHIETPLIPLVISSIVNKCMSMHLLSCSEIKHCYFCLKEMKKYMICRFGNGDPIRHYCSMSCFKKSLPYRTME